MVIHHKYIHNAGEAKLSAAGIRFLTPARARLSMLEDLLDMSLDGTCVRNTNFIVSDALVKRKGLQVLV